MHVSLDRFGRVVQAGEGSYRVPMGADEVDNTLSHPVSAAEALNERNRLEYATMAAEADEADQISAAQAAHQKYMENMAAEYEEYVSEAETEQNGGENPLLYLAAMQTMAGGAHEMYHPLMGHMLSQDGEIAYNRAMSGDIMPSFGQNLQSLIQSAQSAASAAAPIVSQLTSSGGQALPASSSQAPAAAAFNLQSLMSQKVGGIPLPYLAGGVLLLLILKR